MKEEIKELDPLQQAIQELIQERNDLRTQNINLRMCYEKALVRERLYKSELAKTKIALQKLAQSIDTTPYSHAEEYTQYYEEDECLEQ